jgi:SAM-dependent methyltransferase
MRVWVRAGRRAAAHRDDARNGGHLPLEAVPTPVSPTDRTAAAAYDELADDYASEVEASPYNADLAFPGTTAQLPAVDGERVLDAGCGTGAYAEWLADAGADVVGLDVSAEMLRRARDRLGGRVELCRGDLSAPLGFADDAFDGVVSVLALSYVRDWTAVFGEFARVLAPGGFLVVTVTHPFDEFPPADRAAEDGGNGENEADGRGQRDPDSDRPNYFERERRVKQWDVELPYYRRPLSALFDALLDAAFGLEAVAEPRPTDRFRERWPDRYEKESRYPVFLCVRARL